MPTEDTLSEDLPPIGPEEVTAFREATLSSHCPGIPPTWATLYRQCEFRWLARLEVDLQHLLHVDQEYEYLEPLAEGERPRVETRLVEQRERRGLLLLAFESVISVGGRPKVRARTGFFVRVPHGDAQ